MKYVGGGARGPETKAVLTVMVEWVTLVLEWALLKFDQNLLERILKPYPHSLVSIERPRGMREAIMCCDCSDERSEYYDGMEMGTHLTGISVRGEVTQAIA